ncbi:S41 family peptidase [Desertivirga xinjiangensis]|uniref:S41 family peptidase n=1 Tax=Desertivirga xinjiangensis TaxID=539206 RepID=UPI00210F05CF|nr:S41 family peptidase [Pedobacter xinjiangensis]
MKLPSVLSAFLAFAISACHAQGERAISHFNLDLEQLNKSNFPDKWFTWGEGYTVSSDSVHKVSGKYSVVIEPQGAHVEGSFGCPALAIPVDFEGKEVVLTGYLKLENVQEGKAGLMLRIDGKGKPLQFDNMQSRNIHGTIGWMQYQIKLPLSPEAEMIYIAALHTGSGKVWADNFKLTVDGKDLSEVPMKPRKQYKAELDHVYDKGSGVTIQKNLKTIADLVVLGKVWGFLKYYHPEVGTGNLNWDYELFRMIPAVVNSKNKAERNQYLLNYIKTLGPLKAAASIKQDSSLKLKADLSWTEDQSELGQELSDILKQVKLAARGEDHYYINFTKYVGNPIFKNENSYREMTTPDAGFRLLSLFRYWNMIQYYFPYKHLIGEDWHMVLSEFVPKFIGAMDQKSYTVTCLELIARIHDTHANIWGNKFLGELRGKYRVPVQLKFVEDKLAIVAFYKDTLGLKRKLRIGDVITKINGKRVNEIVKTNLPFTPASNYSTQLRDLTNTLLRADIADFKLEVLRDGRKLEVTVQGLNSKAFSTRIDNVPHPEKPSFYMLADNIGYIFPGQYKNEQLPEIKKLFGRAKGIIVDMRCYPSDFMPFTFGKFIKPEPRPFVMFTSTGFEHPGNFQVSKPLDNGGERAGFNGKVVVLVDERTQSQAEYTTMAFQSSPNVTVIGSTTAGADGNVSAIKLPGGLETMISGIGVYYPDGTETQRVGVKIDMRVKPTLAGIKAGRDELLEKAKELILKE